MTPSPSMAKGNGAFHDQRHCIGCKFISLHVPVSENAHKLSSDRFPDGNEQKTGQLNVLLHLTRSRDSRTKNVGMFEGLQEKIFSRR